MSRGVALLLAGLGAADLAMLDVVLVPAFLSNGGDVEGVMTRFVGREVNQRNSVVAEDSVREPVVAAGESRPISEPQAISELPPTSAVVVGGPANPANLDEVEALPAGAQFDAVSSEVHGRRWTLRFPRTGQEQVPLVAEPVLRELAAIIADAGDRQVVVQGHADARGPRTGNRALAQTRAEQVAGRLVELGVDRDRIAVQSYGEDRPIAAGWNREAWSINRRVDVVLLPAQKGDN